MPYAFNQDDYARFQTEILDANGDQATLTSILSDFQGTFVEGMALVESTKADNERISAENERLKSANMQLFLRVGEAAKVQQGQLEQPPKEETGDKFKNADEFMKHYFESLFKKG